MVAPLAHGPRTVRAQVFLALSMTGALISSRSLAAPIEFVEQRDTYVIFDDVDGSVEFANWFDRDPFYAGYNAIEDGFLAVHPDDSQFIVIYTTWELQGAGALYQAVANEVLGIGYQRIAISDPVIPAEIFDDTPNSQVFGFMHMNHWTTYLGDDVGGVDDSRISLLFGQELGHAWLAFPHFDQGGGASGAMLGRSEAHWSFYMHSAGSPVEGHDWIDNKDGTFTAVKHDQFQYSDLDLYLMGLLPAEAVGPWFVLENPTNCVDSSLPNKQCAPASGFQFQADSYTVTATRREIDLGDVIAAEGDRVPAHPDAPDTFDVSFLLIKRPTDVLSDTEKKQIDAIIERSMELWEGQTRGLGHLVNRTALDDGSGTGGSEGTGDDGSSTSNGATTNTTAGDSDSTTEAGESEGSTASAGTDGSTQDNTTGGCSCRSAPSPLDWQLAFFAVMLRRRPTRRSPSP